MNLQSLKSDLKKLSNPEKAKFYPRFFKAGPGGYAEGDIFIGLTVPDSRVIAKKYQTLSLSEIKKLLSSRVHEERLVALLILVELYQKAAEPLKEKVYNFYLANTKGINNWDLVDLSSEKIVGDYIYNHPDYKTVFKGKTFKGTEILKNLAESNNLWERRIAIISTFAFIKKGKLDYTFMISNDLLKDKHDLIHKPVGWMLREAGKKDQKALEIFLKKNYSQIPRTTLRYAIERFPEMTRKAYLNK